MRKCVGQDRVLPHTVSWSYHVHLSSDIHFGKTSVFANIQVRSDDEDFCKNCDLGSAVGLSESIRRSIRLQNTNNTPEESLIVNYCRKRSIMAEFGDSLHLFNATRRVYHIHGPDNLSLEIIAAEYILLSEKHESCTQVLTLLLHNTLVSACRINPFAISPHHSFRSPIGVPLPLLYLPSLLLPSLYLNPGEKDAKGYHLDQFNLMKLAQYSKAFDSVEHQAVLNVALVNSIYCYTHYVGQNALPRTTDNFISLIDRIEHHITFQYKLSDLAAVLLSSGFRQLITRDMATEGVDVTCQLKLHSLHHCHQFRVDGISVSSQGDFTLHDLPNKHQAAIFKLIPEVDSKISKSINSIINEDFNSADNCTMHFMLSHSFNSTFKDIPKNQVKRKSFFRRALDEVEAEFNQLAAGPPKTQYVTSDTVSIEEFGTIYNAFGTTFGGTILAGIAASGTTNLFHHTFKYNKETISIDRVFGITIAGRGTTEDNRGVTEMKIFTIQSQFLSEFTANSKYSYSQEYSPQFENVVNIADALAMASFNYNGPQTMGKLFGPAGTWNCTKCAKHYFLDELRTSDCTDAQMIGAIDGFLLGKTVSNLQDQYHHLATVVRVPTSQNQMQVGSEEKILRSSERTRWNKYNNFKSIGDDIYSMGKYIGSTRGHLSSNNRSIDGVTNYFINIVVCSTDAEVILIMDAVAPPSTNVLAGKLGYYGHIRRHDSIQRTTLDGKVQGKRGRGRRRNCWTLDIQEISKYKINQRCEIAKDRERWRAMVSNLKKEKEPR
ncbi:hypothetical protein GQR58_029909 [Nymphon striatum]|nr:hypothetical protein GQR58_029909 [Nymphon striatum]